MLDVLSLSVNRSSSFSVLRPDLRRRALFSNDSIRLAHLFVTMLHAVIGRGLALSGSTLDLIHAFAGVINVLLPYFDWLLAGMGLHLSFIVLFSLLAINIPLGCGTDVDT